MKYVATAGEPRNKGRTVVDILNAAIAKDREADEILKAPFKTDDWKRTREKPVRDEAYSLWSLARRMCSRHEGYFRK